MSIGAQLRTAREAKGISVGTLSQRIRIQPRVLSAIELDDSSSMPPRPFGRGFVRAYAEEVGLDPDRTVREYFAQFPSTVTAGIPDIRDRSTRVVRDADFTPPSQWSGFAAAVVILLLVVAAAVIFGRRGGAPHEPQAVGTSGGSVATPAATESRPAAAAVETPPSATPQAPSAPAAPARPLTLVLTASRPCWVTADADGRRATFRTLQAGDHETISADREIVLRVGDAGAVSWTLNGREGAPLGALGAVRDLTITPKNAASIQ
jgi:cytoskeleton protein RodZ